MNRENFNNKISKQRKINLISILIILLTGILAIIIKGMPIDSCPLGNFNLHYVVMAIVLLILPSAYITYMIMIRKSLKSEHIESRFKIYNIAYNIRLLALVLVGEFIGIAYIIHPIKNYMLLLIAIILIILLFFPTAIRIKTELQIKEEMFESDN